MWFSVFMSCISLVKLVPKYVTHFDAIEKQLFLNFSFQVVHCLCVEIHLSFVCWSCILWLCWIYLLGLWDSRSFRVYLYIGLCHLWIEKFLLLPFNLGTFFFFFHDRLTRTPNTMLNRRGISRCPCLVPSVRVWWGREFSVFYHWITCVVFFCNICPNYVKDVHFNS